MTTMIKTTAHLTGTETFRLTELTSAESNHVTLGIEIDRLSEIRLVLPAGIGGIHGGSVEDHGRAINWLRNLSSEAAHLADHLEATRWHPANQSVPVPVPVDCEAGEWS